VTGTALPGQSGNVVLAGHRDSFFRDLRNIKAGDIIQVTTEAGQHAYQVQSTRIVNPTEVSVMAPTKDPSLTLITCYPFYYVGNAPKRFIIRAEDEETLDVRKKAPTVPASVTFPAQRKPPRYVSYAVYGGDPPR
jgi:LPXTG-site transpeptidase (sortase) family protein